MGCITVDYVSLMIDNEKKGFGFWHIRRHGGLKRLNWLVFAKKVRCLY